MLGYLVRTLQCSDKILARNAFFLVRDITGLVGKNSHSAAITSDFSETEKNDNKAHAKLELYRNVLI